MNSLKTKTNNYTMLNEKAIAGVVLVPNDDSFTAYVAWEWKEQAKKGFFGISKLSLNRIDLQDDWINFAAGFGYDVTEDKQAQKLFPHLF